MSIRTDSNGDRWVTCVCGAEHNVKSNAHRTPEHAELVAAYSQAFDRVYNVHPRPRNAMSDAYRAAQAAREEVRAAQAARRT